METLCFATFVDTLRKFLQEPNGKQSTVELLLQPIIDCENITNKNGDPMILDIDTVTKWMTRKRDISKPIISSLNKPSVIDVIKNTFDGVILTSLEVGKKDEFFDKLHTLIIEDETITDTKKSRFTDLSIPNPDRLTEIFIHALQAENKTEDRGWLTSIYREGIEDEVKMVLDQLSQEKRKDIEVDLKYRPTSFKRKIDNDNHELVEKIEYNVIYYYVIKDYFAEIEGVNDSTFNRISKRIRKNYKTLDKAGLTQDEIHDHLTDMIATKTGATRTTCEKVVAFFIQNCEVYDEIA